MRISVSLPNSNVDFLDQYVELKQPPSRSAALHRAVHLLKANELGKDYGAAWSEWRIEEELWGSILSDGIA